MSSLAAGKKDGWSARLGNYAEPQSNALPPASFSPEEVAVEMWRLVGLPKRVFLARAIAILTQSKNAGKTSPKPTLVRERMAG